MADDAAAVLDHLGIDRAHIAGASMGGMIAQIFAARFRARTRSLAVIFSSNNQPFLPPPAPRALLAILKGPPPDSPLDVIADNSVRVWRHHRQPPLSGARAAAPQRRDRGLRTLLLPVGRRRHFSAIVASGSLLRYNRQITAPTVVVHGRADKLQRPFGGRAVARAIRGARLVLIDGMGHDLPEQLWDRLIGELTTTFAHG